METLKRLGFQLLDFLVFAAVLVGIARIASFFGADEFLQGALGAVVAVKVSDLLTNK